MTSALLLLACVAGKAPSEAAQATDDADGDGFPTAEDCNDNDPERFPGAVERCDGGDDDCDSEIDEGVIPTWYSDADGDGSGVNALSQCEAPAGYAAEGGDCDDADPAVHPGAVEGCNGLDDDCDGVADDEIAA